MRDHKRGKERFWQGQGGLGRMALRKDNGGQDSFCYFIGTSSSDFFWPSAIDRFFRAFISFSDSKFLAKNKF